MVKCIIFIIIVTFDTHIIYCIHKYMEPCLIYIVLGDNMWCFRYRAN